MTHDTNGRAYAKLSEVKAGDTLEADSGFTCVKAGPVKIEQDDAGLFFRCGAGRHHIDGQADDSEHLVGLYPVTAH